MAGDGNGMAQGQQIDPHDHLEIRVKGAEGGRVDQEIDASTINELTIMLLRSGRDGRFDDGNEEYIVATSVELSDINSRQAIMELSGTLLADDDYQIIVNGSGPSIVLNLAGAALDGEFTGNFPSGNGIEGGNFASTFTIRGANP